MWQTDLVRWKRRWVRWCSPVTIAVVLAGSAHSRLIAGVKNGEAQPKATCLGPQEQSFPISASFADKEFVSPDERLELLLGRSLDESEGRLSVFINTTDVSVLFRLDGLRLRYNAKLWPLPLGESTVTVYLVSKDDQWKEVARFPLRVGTPAADAKNESRLTPNFLNAGYSGSFHFSFADKRTDADESVEGRQQPAPSPSPASKTGKIKLVPSLTLGLKTQPAQSTFPVPDTPVERATFADLTMQASLKNDVTYGGFSSQSSADFAGSSFGQEALRFGELGNNAPRVDLSSYLLQFQTGPVKYQVGHVSFGAERHLINGFSSRGITITVPFLKRFDFSAAAMNGTQLVGYGNFFGLNRRKHQVLSGTLGLEIFAKRPGGLRLEVGVLAAHSQPINGVNRGAITDEERSRGFSLRLIANDKDGRFHFEGGFTRSFFVNPAQDPANTSVTLGLANNAHYLEASYQILKDFSLSKTRKANLTVAFAEENVAPLFRSLGASTQADKIQYQFSVNGSLDEITGKFSYANFHNNLRNIPSIFRSLNHLINLSLAAPAKALLGRTKDSPWLPRLGYSFSRVHAFGAAIPVNGGFQIDLSSIPNLFGDNHTFSADWQVKRFTFGYSLNRSLQDNQQIGHERADQAVLTNTGKLGIAVNSKLKLNLDISAESSADRETSRIKRTYRLAPGITWQLTKQMELSSTLSNTIVGDLANTSRDRNTRFDVSWTYGFSAGTQELKKLSGQFAIRYSNGYSHSLDRILLSDTLKKDQMLSANMSVTFF